MDADVLAVLSLNRTNNRVKWTNEFTVTITENNNCIRFFDANNKQLFKIVRDGDDSFYFILAYLRLLHKNKEKEQK